MIIFFGDHTQKSEFKQRCRRTKSYELLKLLIRELIYTHNKKKLMLNVGATKSYQDIAPISLSRLYSDSSPGILVLPQMVNQMSVRDKITREPYVDQLQKISQIE